jgi:hypothetical protein
MTVIHKIEVSAELVHSAAEDGSANVGGPVLVEIILWSPQPQRRGIQDGFCHNLPSSLTL